MENTNLEEMMKFAKGYRTLHKESRSIIDFLRSCENNTFRGKQIELLEKCGYKLVKYINEERSKSYSSNLGQFRKLGIIELSELGIMDYEKDKGQKSYTFRLADDWVDILMLMDKIN